MEVHDTAIGSSNPPSIVLVILTDSDSSPFVDGRARSVAAAHHQTRYSSHGAGYNCCDDELPFLSPSHSDV